MQRYPSQLPVGFSNAHIAGGGQTFSGVCFTLSLSWVKTQTAVCVWNSAVCFFSSSCFWSFIIPRSTSPLTQRESPDRKFYPAANRGKKNYLFFFWVVTKRTSLAGDGGMEGGGRSTVTAYRGCMWGQKGPKEEGGDGEQSGPYLPQHRGALGRTGLFRQKHILTCRPPTQKREQSDFRGPAEYSKEDQITLNSGKWWWCFFCLHWENASLLSNLF